MNFELFNKKLEETKADKDDILSGPCYIYNVLFHCVDVSDIDFDRFTSDDLETAMDLLTNEITNEDDDGEILLSPRHPLCVMQSAYKSIRHMNNTPRRRTRSAYRFI